MKLLLRSRNFTKSRILKYLFAICLFYTTAATGSDLVDNTLETGENLFSAVPASILATGTAGFFFTYRAECSTGHQDFLLGEPFKTADAVDNFLMGAVLPISSAALWTAGSLWDSPSVENTGEELCRGLLYTYGISAVLKFSAGRMRPDGTNTRSFPSGHAAGAACAAAVIWDNHGPQAGIPFSLIALYTCLSRVNLGRHFPSDVVMGAAIGAACGIAASMVHNGIDSQASKFSFSLSVDTEGRIIPALW